MWNSHERDERDLTMWNSLYKKTSLCEVHKKDFTMWHNLYKILDCVKQALTVTQTGNSLFIRITSL